MEPAKDKSMLYGCDSLVTYSFEHQEQLCDGNDTGVSERRNETQCISTAKYS